MRFLSSLAQTKPNTRQTRTETERVIISNAPQHSSRVHALISRLLGKFKSENVSKHRVELLEPRLKQVGAKVTRLREHWSRSLTKRKEDRPLTPEQQAAVDKASNSPATTSVSVLQMPDAAVAELALTRFEQSVGSKGRAGPQDDPYITRVRTRSVDLTAGGVTWVGATEETGERAVLMLWKDGHLSGYFGYKG